MTQCYLSSTLRMSTVKPSLIIIGLGNPGMQYAGTRHNVGFAAIEKLSEEFGTGKWLTKQKFLAEVCEGRIVAMPILLVKPMTYMNDSGSCMKKIVDFYKLDPAKQVLVICDDVDQLVGESRLRKSGGPGTHNGLKSIVNQIGGNFLRLRIGVRGADAPQGSFQKAGDDLAAYVLSKPLKKEMQNIDKTITESVKMIRKLVP
jgi:peptidyl-tRNA hydrolase, PTH1 family